MHGRLGAQSSIRSYIGGRVLASAGWRCIAGGAFALLVACGNPNAAHAKPAKEKKADQAATKVESTTTTTTSTKADAADGTASLTINGTVTDPAGRLLPDTTVTLSRIGLNIMPRPGMRPEDLTKSIIKSQLTDSKGAFKFVVPREDDRRIWEQISGTVVTVTPTSGPIARMNLMQTYTEAERSMNMNVRSVFTANLKLTTGSVLQGTVTDAKGKPVRGTTVTITSAFSPQNFAPEFLYPILAVTDDKGHFITDRVTTRSYEVSLNAKGLGEFSQTITPPANLKIVLKPGTSSISGAVFRAEDKDPVASATVQLFRKSDFSIPGDPFGFTQKVVQTVQSDGEGLFSFDGVSAGNYAISAVKGKTLRPYPELPLALTIADNESTDGIELKVYAGYTVSGKVTNKANDKPVAGVTVRGSYAGQSGPDIPEDVSDKNGEFKITGLFGMGQSQTWLSISSKDYRLAPRGQNEYQGQSIAVRLPAKGFNAEDVNIVVTAPIKISGKVINDLNAPIAGVKIFTVAPNDWEGGRKVAATTGDDGLYSAEVVPGKKVRVRAEHKSYGPGLSELVTVEDEPTSVPDITLKAAGTIRGRVEDDAGSPVDGATINAYYMVNLGNYGMGQNLTSDGEESSNQNITSASDGSFTISRVPADTNISLAASKPGSARSKVVTAKVDSGGVKDNVVLKLRKPLTISGIVVDDSGKPLAAANVNCNENQGGGYGNATTDKDGKFEIKDLGTGSYQVYVWLNGYEQQDRNTAVQAGATNLKIVLKKMNSSGRSADSKQKTAKFTGKVVDAETGNPVEKFSVKMGNVYNWESVTNNSKTAGVFIIDEFPIPTSTKFSFTAAGYAPMVTDTLNFGAAETNIERTFKLSKGSQVTGRIVDGDKKPVVGARVSQLVQGDEWTARQSEPIKTVRTGDDGTFTLPNVPPGANRITIRASGFAELTHNFEAKTGQPTDLGDITLTGGSTVRVKVIKRPNDTPVPGITVQMSANESRPEQVTDATGIATFTKVPSGQFYIYTQGSGNSNSNVGKSITVNGKDDQQVELIIGDATLKITALIADKPASGAYISVEASGTTANGTADSEGKVTIAQLPAGKVNITGRIYTNGRNSSVRDSVDIKSGEEKEVTLKFPNTNLRGKVVDAEGKALSGVKVVATASSAADSDDSYLLRKSETTSQDDGTFSILGLEPGSYGVSARKEGVGAAVATGINVPKDTPSEIVTLTLKNSGGTLVNTALDLDTGKPIPEAWCYLTSSAGRFDHGITRGSDGTITITDIPPGQYAVQVSYWGCSVDEQSVTIEEGKSARIDSVLYAAGALRWNLRKKDGGRASGVPVKITPNDASSIEKERTGTTDKNGLVVVRGLYPGTYTATALPASSASVSTQVTIIAKNPTDVTTTLNE